MIQIELTGCTGAGKSTLARGIVQACREQGIDVVMGDEVVLGLARLNWLRGSLARTLCLDLICLPAWLATWGRHRAFHAFTIRTIWRLPIAWTVRLNLLRNVLKKMGTHEIVRRRSPRRQVALVDEGTLHAAHNLFVHVAVPPSPDDIATFARLAPLPDAAVYVKQQESVLIERTLARGHKRIEDRSSASVQLFVERAIETFEMLWQQAAISERLLVVDGRQEIVVPLIRACANGSLPAAASDPAPPTHRDAPATGPLGQAITGTEQ